MPSYYTWNTKNKVFERRKQGKSVDGQHTIFKDTTIGRLYTVHPNQHECFFLRLLLVNVPGPTSFEYLRTVNGTIHDTYRSACQALNLLENDQHWDNCINDACETSTPSQIRALFGIILTTCSPSAPTELWEKYKSKMSEDILHRKQLETSDMTFDFTSEIYNYTLVIIEDLCVRMANKPLQDLGMPSPNRIAAVSTCVELDREQSYSTSDLLSYVQNNISELTSEQKDIYDTIDSISGRIQLPADFCNLVTSKNEMIEKVFPNILKNYKNNKWLSERAILAPKNIDVHEINNIVLTKIRDQVVLYKSVDTVLEPNEAVNYPSDFLNSIDLSGFPPHVLQLKIGVPIILLRNINPPKLCNGTRLAVKTKQWKT